MARGNATACDMAIVDGAIVADTHRPTPTTLRTTTSIVSPMSSVSVPRRSTMDDNQAAAQPPWGRGWRAAQPLGGKDSGGGVWGLGVDGWAVGTSAPVASWG
jgi:hypothetical protein